MKTFLIIILIAVAVFALIKIVGRDQSSGLSDRQQQEEATQTFRKTDSSIPPPQNVVR